MAFFAFITYCQDLFLLSVLRVGVTIMAKRGRKPLLEDKITTCVTAEKKHIQYLQDNGIEVSKFFRDNVEALMRFNSSPIEKKKQEIEDRKAIIKENEIAIASLLAEIKKLEEIKAKEEEEGKEFLEFEGKRREYVKGCISSMRTQNTCNGLWINHLLEAWKFTTPKEAKEYVTNVWIEEGVPVNKVKRYLRLEN